MKENYEINVKLIVLDMMYFLIILYNLQELVKYTTRLGEPETDLQKALELMLSVPHRAIDNKFLQSIEGYRGELNIKLN